MKTIGAIDKNRKKTNSATNVLQNFIFKKTIWQNSFCALFVLSFLLEEVGQELRADLPFVSAADKDGVIEKSLLEKVEFRAASPRLFVVCAKV